MSSKKILGALAALAAAGLVAAPAASATPSAASEAFALSAKGLLNIDPLPYVNGKNGYDHKKVAEVPAKSVQVRALEAEAGKHNAKATVVNVSVDLGLDLLKELKLGGGQLLSAQVITSKCDKSGVSSSLVGAKLLGKPLDVAVPANTGIEVPGLAKVMLNEQVKNKNGTTTVNAISIKVSELQKITVASATCTPGKDGNTGGETGTSPTGKPSPTSKPSSATSKPSSSSSAATGDNGVAPKPVPAPAQLDVTG
ncbi:choice-of-anchor P family protein [Allokutzneria sp. A3M-2-11 16]|uniref:choice-of-anchor P family protein n=1 Tax=Allokutzneria sp. A3M-2-11 16 TaxID=2962043 RepID=UPI0020B664A1|nr:choice-of-anchor P family protein [Allokutzneria sp. A3M-2-11 16]MCP3800862.1 choice-of-anchor P family protein [Allokutzneria sp. A3M-2-11 16]